MVSTLTSRSPEEVQKFRDQVERSLCEDSLYDFLRVAWPMFDPDPFIGGWHLAAIADHLMAVSAGDIKRLLINVRPRSSKTSLVAIAWPVWTWAQEQDLDYPLIGPGVRFLCGSYGAGKAQEDAVTSRRLIASEWFQRLWGHRVQITRDRDNQERYDTTAGGSRISTGVPESLGKGGMIKILDDPHKTTEVESDTTREQVIQNYKEIWQTRSNSPTLSADVMVMQRLGEDDLSQYWIDNHDDTVHLCYDAETEILTENGWIGFPDLVAGVRVLAARPSDLKAEWQMPTGYVRHWHDGEMVHYKSGTCDMLVTPDHRVFYKDHFDWKNGNITTDWRVKPASQAPRNLMLPQAVMWPEDGPMVEFGGHIWEPELLGEFMGWFLSEGCTSPDRNNIRIVQKDGPKSDRLQVCLARLPFTVGKHKGSAPDTYCYGFSDRTLAAELRKLGKSRDKYIPDVVKNLPAKALRKLIKAFCDGDGQANPINPMKWTLISISKRLIDDLQECAVKAGWATSASARLDSTPSFFDGYARKPTTTWRLYVRTGRVDERKWYADLTSEHVTKPHYTGLVYCVSVPYGGVVVRRNGRVTVSGNCIPTWHEADRVCTTYVNGYRFWTDPREVEGENFWPQRYPPSYRKVDEALGKFPFAGQIQQRPEPRGGGIIQRMWWRPWPPDDSIDSWTNEEGRVSYPPWELQIAYLDTAFTKKEVNDFCAMTRWGVFGNDRGTPCAMLCGQWHDRLSFDELLTKVLASCREWRTDLLVIENKAGGIWVRDELIRYMRAGEFTIELDTPVIDKMARANAVVPLFSGKLVYAPFMHSTGTWRTWAEETIANVEKFPMARHDDICDTVTGALGYLRRNGLIQFREEHDEEEEEARRFKGNHETIAEQYGVA